METVTLSLKEFHDLRSQHLEKTTDEFVRFLNGNNPTKTTYVSAENRLPFTKERVKQYQRPGKLKAAGLKPLKFKMIKTPGEMTITKAIEIIKPTNPAAVLTYRKSAKTAADQAKLIRAAYSRKYLEKNREAITKKRRTPEFLAKKRKYEMYPKAIERRKAYNLALMEKRNLAMGNFPPGKNAIENFWHQIFLSGRDRRTGAINPDARFQVIESTLPRRRKGLFNWTKENSQKIKFKDTANKNAIVTFKNLESYINKNKNTFFPKNYKFTKTPFDRALLPFVERRVLNDLTVGPESTRLTSALNKALLPGYSNLNRLASVWNVHHPEGLAKNPVYSHLASYDANAGEWRPRKEFTEGLAKVKNVAEKNKLIETFRTQMPEGIVSRVGGVTAGTEPALADTVIEMAKRGGLEKELKAISGGASLQKHLEGLVNQESLKTTGRIVCKSGCLAVVAKENPAILQRAFSKLGSFASLLGRGGVKAAPYAAIAAVGAAAEPLVKQFRNDDPTTYMTDPDQQKGVLLSLVEAETPKVDEEILNWQYPGMVAGAAAALPGSSAVYKARRKPFKTRAAMGPARAALGPVGKFLAGSFSPLGVAASLPVHIAAQVKGGAELEDIATDPVNWVGPAFASTGAKAATRGMSKTGILSKALRMGMSPAGLRVLSRGGIYGLLASAGLKGYDIWENSKYK